MIQSTMALDENTTILNAPLSDAAVYAQEFLVCCLERYIKDQKDIFITDNSYDRILGAAKNLEDIRLISLEPIVDYLFSIWGFTPEPGQTTRGQARIKQLVSRIEANCPELISYTVTSILLGDSVNPSQLIEGLSKYKAPLFDKSFLNAKKSFTSTAAYLTGKLARACLGVVFFLGLLTILLIIKVSLFGWSE